MAVISFCKRWPNARVPYVAESSSIEEWLQEINTAVGFDLLVPKEDGDTDFLSAKRGNGKSESIGHTVGCGEYKISAQRKLSMQHEALHALGFHHEQLHAMGPWGAFGTKATSASRIDTRLLEAWGRRMAEKESAAPLVQVNAPVSRTLEDLESRRAPTSTNGRPRRMSISHGTPELEINQQAIDAHKKAFDAAITDNNIMHILSCDFSSIMMYSQMRQAAADVGLDDKMVKTGICAGAEFLSNGDVTALQYMYNTCTTVALVRT